MTHLYIDIETYSSVDIAEGGAYKYAAAPDFQILLFAYSVDMKPVEVVDLANGETLPDWLVDAIRDDGSRYIKHAYNAAFEQLCLNMVYGSPISGWRCTMFKAAYCGLPLGLSAASEALGLPEDKAKLAIGKALIKLFCVPNKKSNQMSLFPTERVGKNVEPEKWALFIEYNRRDVEAEIEIEKRLANVKIPEAEQRNWEIDIAINQRGVALDKIFIENAIRIYEGKNSSLIEEGKKITGLDNPVAPLQLAGWLEKKLGRPITSMAKADVEKMAQEESDLDVRRALQIRLESAKTSVKKYDAMLAAECSGRAHGLLQFYGSRTGRWAGRLIQVQNLPRNYIETLDIARRFVKKGDGEAIEFFYGNVPDTLSQLIRTAFIPSEGNVFLVADYSAIEARVISWLADENWRLDVFRKNGDIYCESASQMFKVPVEKHGVNSHLRQKGKIAELALGYQGAVGALAAMGAKDMGLSESELKDIVSRWRKANPKIVNLWRTIEEAAIYAIRTGATQPIPRGLIGLDHIDGRSVLFIQLPSGRRLFYQNPKIYEADVGMKIGFSGQDQMTRKWKELETYGGKLVENIVQATARDCLAEAINRLEAAGFQIVMHVHDEVVIDHRVPEGSTAEAELKKVIATMCAGSSWNTGLPLNADGFTSSYYKKD